MADYTPEELKGLQEKSLEMAVYFVDFCKKHDLLCYFCGGGAIGALRHQGFIPWDDDLDFFMPRKDYERQRSCKVRNSVHLGKIYVCEFASCDTDDIRHNSKIEI